MEGGVEPPVELIIKSDNQPLNSDIIFIRELYKYAKKFVLQKQTGLLQYPTGLRHSMGGLRHCCSGDVVHRPRGHAPLGPTRCVGVRLPRGGRAP